eukprot:4847894-Amphidinium_carterae.1
MATDTVRNAIKPTKKNLEIHRGDSSGHEGAGKQGWHAVQFVHVRNEESKQCVDYKQTQTKLPYRKLLKS